MLTNQLHRQRGVSIIEFMIGSTIGLMVVLGSVVFFTRFIEGNKDVLLATKMSEELRVVSDVISRDIKRSGYWRNSPQGISNGAVPATATNPYAWVSNAPTTGFSYSYARDSNNILDASETFGFKAVHGVIQMYKNSRWEPITDPDTVTVTTFMITPQIESISLLEFCENPCPAGSVCAPEQTIRSYDLLIEAHATVDTALTRKITKTIRVRNDQIVGACP